MTAFLWSIQMPTLSFMSTSLTPTIASRSVIAEAIGRPVAFIDVPSDAFAGALKAAGDPAWQVDGLVEDYAHDARGEAETTSPHVREVTGGDPRDMGEFAKDYARAFVGA
jgi:hypothetical protein